MEWIIQSEKLGERNVVSLLVFLMNDGRLLSQISYE